ncbi:MAG TPA: SDR family oxidoreductase [Bacteroidales bacterium]|nr:SDR family oxidoreductase [Bacteroidales bacterium]HQP14607.1 SDR family oxidoreductase [Bacteroidales bacterium]
MIYSSDLLKNKTALITGSNRGIGKAILETFARSGANIVACARKETPEFIEYVKNIAKTYKVNTQTLFFDLTDENEIKESLKKLFNEKCQIDILVNNAGVAHGGFLQMTSLSKIKEIFEINFFSQLLIIQYITKIMLRQKCGSIINIGSVAGMDSYPGYSAYGTSKAALIHATKTLSQEFAPYKIRINAIAPGLTATDMSLQMEEKASKVMISDSAMKRLATPQEIADTALFLASDMSSFINGQVIRVDGGMK